MAVREIKVGKLYNDGLSRGRSKRTDDETGIVVVTGIFTTLMYGTTQTFVKYRYLNMLNSEDGTYNQHLALKEWTEVNVAPSIHEDR